jgi:hypothetical protein
VKSNRVADVPGVGLAGRAFIDPEVPGGETSLGLCVVCARPKRSARSTARTFYKQWAGRRIRGGEGGNAHFWWITGCLARGFSSKAVANVPGGCPPMHGSRFRMSNLNYFSR